MSADLDDQDLPERDIRMTFLEHLEELRKRLLYAAVGMVPGVAVAWAYKDTLLDWLGQPLLKAFATLHLEKPSLNFIGLADPFVAYMKLSLVVGLGFSAPWVFWQLWAFIAPALYERERRLALPFVIASTLFFIGGALFGYYVVFPMGFETLLSFSGALPSGDLHVTPMLTLGEYLDFVLQMLVAFGVVFEVPVIVTFLSLAGIVNWKQLLDFGRWWIVIASIIAAVLTPPDVGSQLLMLIPLIVLYFGSVVIAYFLGPQPEPEPVES